MKMREIFSKPQMQPFRRFAAIVLSACLVYCLVVLFAKRALPWAGMVAATVPLLVVVFVIIPMVRASKTRASRAGASKS
jgi:hypothetical protein